MTVEIKNLFKIDKFCFAIIFGSKIAYCVLLISMYCILQQSNFKECTVQYNSIQTKNLNLISVGNY